MENQNSKQSGVGGSSSNRERTHGRTLSVPSISTSEHNFSRSPSPAAPLSSTAAGPSQFPNNMYLTPTADGSANWSNTGLRPGSSGSNAVRSRSASTSSLTNQSAAQALKKKVVTACQRCRTRKIKCDGILPCCGNCAKAGQVCMEVDKSGERDIPRSHVLELENRIKYLEGMLSSRCPDLDFSEVGPTVELRTRPAPPSIRIVTSGPNLQPGPSSSQASSSPISAISTPISFDFSPGNHPMSYSPGFSPFSFSEPPSSAMPSPMLSPACSPFLTADHGMGGSQYGDGGSRRNSIASMRPDYNRTACSPFLTADHGMGGSQYGDGGSRRNSIASMRPDYNRTFANRTAQDLGLVAIGLTEDTSRYIGASSGFEFARMMFADCPMVDTNSNDRTGSAQSLAAGDEDRTFLRRRSSSTLSGVLSSNSSTTGDSATGSITPSAHHPQPKSRRGSTSEGLIRKRGRWSDTQNPTQLPNTDEMNQLTSIFFDNVNLQYPFLERQTFETCREIVYLSEKGGSASFNHIRRTTSIPILPPGHTLATARFHVFMVFATASSILCARSEHYKISDSEGYFNTAMSHVENDEVKLRGSIQGLQNLLLLAMYTLHVDGGGGLSIWPLNSAAVAGCIEIGLHKNDIVSLGESGKPFTTVSGSSLAALKRRVFWSVYALDRNLGIMLGRPFALDESECDVDLPDNLVEERSVPVLDRLAVPVGVAGNSATLGPEGQNGAGDGALTSISGTVHLLNMIRIASIIKTTLYRVSPAKPSVYPTPTWISTSFSNSTPSNYYVDDLADWQNIIQNYLSEIRQQSKATPSSSQSLNQTIELKYHEAIQLLYRPSPVIPIPGAPNILICLHSTVETIRMYSSLKDSGVMGYSTFNAHWVFLSGLSMMWCFKSTWPTILATPGRKEQKIESLKEDIKKCSDLLEEFGKWWKVMQRAKERFDGNARVTLGILVSQATASQSQSHLVVGTGLGLGSSAKLLSPGQHFPAKHQHQHQHQHHSHQHSTLSPRVALSPHVHRAKPLDSQPHNSNSQLFFQQSSPQQQQAMGVFVTGSGNALLPDDSNHQMFLQNLPQPPQHSNHQVPDLGNWLLVTPSNIIPPDSHTMGQILGQELMDNEDPVGLDNPWMHMGENMEWSQDLLTLIGNDGGDLSAIGLQKQNFDPTNLGAGGSSQVDNDSAMWENAGGMGNVE